MLLREVLDELQHGAVCHQIQRTLALVVGVADISTFLRQKTGDSHGDVQLGVSQETRRVQLWTEKEEDERMRMRREWTSEGVQTNYFYSSLDCHSKRGL